jgi:hypothetical protein
MATDSVMGLFTDPQQYQQAQNNAALQRGIDLAQLDPFQRASAQLYQGGYMAGGAIGGALGAEDPMLQRQTQRRSFIQQIDMTDPNSLVKGIRASSSDPELNAFLLGKYKELETINKTKAETVAKMREGNAAMLTTEQRNFKQAQDDGYKGSFNQWLTEQKRAGANNISLSATADKSYGSELGGLVAKSDIALRDTATAAPEVLSSIERTRSLLDSGKVFTGTGANAKLNVLAFGQALGVTGATENDIITSTQQLQQQRAKAVQSQIKSSGLGSAQGFTDKDLKFLEQASAGTITLSADTLKEQLRIEEKLARSSVNKWNARVKTLPSGLTTSMGLSEVTLPTSPYKPSAQIPTTGGTTGNALIDKYLVAPQEGK